MAEREVEGGLTKLVGGWGRQDGSVHPFWVVRALLSWQGGDLLTGHLPFLIVGVGEGIYTVFAVFAGLMLLADLDDVAVAPH